MLIFLPFIGLFNAKRKFIKVNAICVKVNVSVSRRRRRKSTCYNPVWKYSYDSQEYRTAMNTGSSLYNIPIGAERNIYVNPENPSDIFVPFVRSFVTTTIVGLIFLGGSFLIIKNSFM